MMRSNSLFLTKTIATFSLAACVGSAVFALFVTSTTHGQDKNKPKISEAEAKAASAVNTAPDAAAKLAMATEFVKKYPKSTARLELAWYVAGQIADVKDAAQRLALAEGFQKAFTGDKELEAIRTVIIGAYVESKRIDDAFSLAATVLAQQPENVGVLSQMTIAGTGEAKRQNPKYAAQSLQYGLKAIELIEANKKPANFDETAWASQKAMLPHLYQNMAILSLVNGNAAAARTHLEKAVTLNPSEPFNYVLLGSIVNDEYQKLAQTYKSMPESKEKEETLRSASELLDKVIDLYAHAVAASEGKPEYQQLHDQIMQDLTPYYKYRHNQSTDGLRQLIDKYKTPAKP